MVMGDDRSEPMKIEQLHLESLGHASYVIGSDDSGEALVVDPQRDVRPYLDVAREQGWRIRWVADTHQHNDYLSGLAELAARTGATALGSAYAELGYRHREIGDGERFDLGEVGVEVLHTPGHTPEHVSFLLYDGEQDDRTPAALLSGGALLVGDLARPDLLGDEEETQQAAEQFCHTIQTRLLALPDHVLVYPTHVAGSLCGGSIGSRLVTSVGYERATNEVLREVEDAEGFVARCLDLEDLPAVPPYWIRMRSRNQQGVEPLGAVDPPPALTPGELAKQRDAGHLVLDARSAEAFAGGHIPGALNVESGSSFPTWAGTVLPEDAEVLLVVEGPQDVEEVTWSLLRIGYPRPAGWLADGMMGWRTAVNEVATLPTLTPDQVADDLDDYHVLDVRQPSEWSAGHAPGAQLITGAELPQRLDEVPDDRPVLTMCGSGFRSSVAASLLRHHGHERVINLSGGWAAWSSHDLPTTG
jgi:hydroxyacylglutathione hydrolase